MRSARRPGSADAGVEGPLLLNRRHHQKRHEFLGEIEARRSELGRPPYTCLHVARR